MPFEAIAESLLKGGIAPRHVRRYVRELDDHLGPEALPLASGLGAAAEHGFQVGDVLLEVGGKTVSTPADVRKSLADARSEGKHTVLFRVKSGDGTKFVALPLGNA